MGMTRVGDIDMLGAGYAGAVADIAAEVRRARRLFPPFNSAHEGYAVLMEELDEVWDAVKANRLDAAIAEAVQVGAMAVRFVADMRAKQARDQREVSADA